jgi:hypothetical protein
MDKAHYCQGYTVLYVVCFTLCAHTVELVFIYISELYNFSVIMQEKQSIARTITIQ